MKNSKRILILSIALSILLLWFNMFRFDIAIKANKSFGLLIVAGLMSFVPYVIYGGWTIWITILVIKNRKNNVRDGVISLVAIALTIALLTVIPYTDAFVKMSYLVNKNNLTKTIDMINDSEIELPRTNTNEYIVPFRLTSYTGRLYTYEIDNVTKIMFYVFSGIRGGVVLVYSPDGSGLKNADFERRFENIEKVDENWYSAHIKY